jgi:hypothetical protein
LFETQSKDAAIISNFFRDRPLDPPGSWASVLSRKASNKKCRVQKKNIDTVHFIDKRNDCFQNQSHQYDQDTPKFIEIGEIQKL